jgi:hypothetical protein
MKKFIALVVVILVLSSCVTAPIVKIEKRPMAPGKAWLTGFIPGLTQLMSREYAESLFYFVATVAPIAIASKLWTDGNGKVKSGYEAPYLAAGAVSSAAYVWSYADGVVSAAVRNDQWMKFSSSSVKLLRIGLPSNEVRTLVGDPDRTEKSTSKAGNQEVWIYSRGWVTERFVFDNGILVEMQK